RSAGWICGCISSTNQERRQFWVVAAELDDAGRFIVEKANDNLTGFLELEAVIRKNSIDSIPRHLPKCARAKSVRRLPPRATPDPLPAGITVSERLVHTTK